jgi:hypothetical protein
VTVFNEKPTFDRPTALPLQERREHQASEGRRAMADYIRARQTVLERMIKLRAARLRATANTK